MAEWQSAFHAPVSQPRPILPMQAGFRVDLEALVGVAVGTVVDVGVGAPSSTVTGVLVGVGVWVGVGVAAGAPSEPPSSASKRAVSALMSARSELISPPCSSIWSRWVFTWFRSVPTWPSSWLTLALTFPDVVTVVAVRVGVGVIGAPLSSRVVVGVRVGVGIGAPLSSRSTVGVRVGVAVGGVPVAVGVAVGGVPVTVGVCVGVGVSVAVGVCVGVGVAVAETLVGVRVGVAADDTLVGGESSPVPNMSFPQHAAAPFVRTPQETLPPEPRLMDLKVKPVGGSGCP